MIIGRVVLSEEFQLINLFCCVRYLYKIYKVTWENKLLESYTLSIEKFLIFEILFSKYDISLFWHILYIWSL